MNNFSMSGRLTSDAKIFEGKNGNIYRFDLAHNFGRGMDTLFINCVMYPKNGKKDVDIPSDLLKKGTPVYASGYIRPNVSEKDGKKYRSIDFVVLSISSADDEVESEETEENEE